VYWCCSQTVPGTRLQYSYTTVVQRLIVWELTTLLCRDQMLEDLKSKCVSWRHCKNACHTPDACDSAGLEVGFLNFHSWVLTFLMHWCFYIHLLLYTVNHCLIDR